jgi:hypothetical protein
MPTANLMRASLSPSDAAALFPHLKSVHLAQQKVLYDAGDPIRAVYFPTSAIVSLVVALSTGEMIEAAMVGRDGVVGASASLDGKISLSRAIVQMAGDAMICEVSTLKGAAMQSENLLSLLVRHNRLRAGPAIHGVHGDPPRRGATLPLAAAGKRPCAQ